MFKRLTLTFQIAAVFIGTVVGAGLASGQEIAQFFSTYGYKSFLGLLICFVLCIMVSKIVIHISIKYNLGSYKDLINLVMPGYLGRLIDILTSLFLISSAAIILAGSGALLHQYFNLNKWVGIIFMIIASLIVLLRDTKGLIELNSLTVPCLIIVITTLFLLYTLVYKNINFSCMVNAPCYKSFWIPSSILYCSFNLLSSTGVIVALTKEFREERLIFNGIILGSLVLTFLSFIINFILILNMPYIFKYEIPLLYVSNRFGKLMEALLLGIIWCEMFSTEVSDIYSVSKTLEQRFKISYKKCCFLVLLIAIPISQIGFVKLITFLYPAFGLISFIFIIKCLKFYLTNK